MTARPSAQPDARMLRLAAAGSPDGKVDRIVKHCVYEIATGAWSAERRLPSLREARQLWSVNHLTVLRAYRRLVAMGLVVNVTRAGFFVAKGSAAVRALGRGRDAMTELYHVVCRRLDREGHRSRLAVFRDLARRAEAEARRSPECAFVECTAFQAEQHAREIQARLDVPCLALTTEAIAAPDGVPAHVRTLLTTSFHHDAVARVSRRRRLGFAPVPIVFSRQLAARLAADARPVAILALDADTAAHVARTARELIARSGVAVTSASALPGDLEMRIRKILDGHGRRAPTILLSTSLWTAWSALPAPRRRGLRVRPFEYEISAEAWPAVAAALGLPLGALA